MMQRCIFLQFSSTRRSVTHLTRQKRYFSSSRKDFSGAPKLNASSPPPPEKQASHAGKVVFGGLLIGGALTAAAYKAGYFNQSHPNIDSFDPNKDNNSNTVTKDVEPFREQIILSNQEPGAENNNSDTRSNNHLPHVSDSSQIESGNQVGGDPDVTPKEDLPTSSQICMASDNQKTDSETPSVGILEPKEGGNGAVHDAPTFQEKAVSSDTKMEATSPHHLTSEDVPEASLVNDAKSSNSLLNEYFLREKDGESNGASLGVQSGDGSVPHSKEKEDTISVSEELKDAYITKDGRLVLDFLQAIHYAEERQEELDARIFAEEKILLKEKYEKELKDARARELMYAEEAAILDKELNKERTKAVTTVKLLQEKAEEKLKMELERKENELELQLKKVKELAKAELAAAIASEKASQIEKMSEANLNINALCLAFYARSEEARQTHSVHKLALGALALEDAISKGLPIQSEINAMHTYLEGVDKDSLLDLALSSLPVETLNSGTDTQLELNQKFDALKGSLRHFSLIPPGGGGMLAHGLAHIASWLKVKEYDVSGDGIECIINRVERFLGEGKLVEAADALEGGVRGSQAEDIIGDWVRQVRNRAITEQALSLIQSYAIAASVA